MDRNLETTWFPTELDPIATLLTSLVLNEQAFGTVLEDITIFQWLCILLSPIYQGCSWARLALAWPTLLMGQAWVSGRKLKARLTQIDFTIIS